MNAVRRVYVYLAAAAALAASVTSLIALLRNLLTPGVVPSLVKAATQIGTLLVAVPLYLVHWRWAQRAAASESADAGIERASVMRQVYLYAAMAALLAGAVNSAFGLLSGVFSLSLGVPPADYRIGKGAQGAALLIHYGLPLVILALLWAYHRQVASRDAALSEEAAGAPPIQRIYTYGASGAGLIMTSLTVIGLLRVLMIVLGSSALVATANIAREVARLAVGMTLWLAFWTGVQRASAAPESEERVSTPRRVYFYSALLVSILGTVATLAMALASVLDRLIGRWFLVGVPGSGGDLRQAISVLVVLGVVWGYHAWVLRHDASATGAHEAGSAWVPRLYRYLVAGAGLGAVLAGLAGILGVLMRALGGVAGPGPAGQAADYTAALIAGLPVWILAWRQVQGEAALPGPEGEEGSQSTIRKVYLYAFLFVATLTILGSGVFVISRLVGLALGVQRGENLLAEIAQALGYALIAVAVWVYHGGLLRADGRRAHTALSQRLASLSVVLLDPANGPFGQAFLSEIQRALPGLWVTAIGAEAPAAADVIVAPWGAAVGAHGDEGSAMVRDLAQSAGIKLILPEQREGWHFLGAEALTPQVAARQAVQAIQEIAGGTRRPPQRLSGLAIAGIVVGVLLLLVVLVPLVAMLLRFN
ncbi:MAG: DUF5671 domain-containing protein [Anaerolineae bacterium]